MFIVELSNSAADWPSEWRNFFGARLNAGISASSNRLEAVQFANQQLKSYNARYDEQSMSFHFDNEADYGVFKNEWK